MGSYDLIMIVGMGGISIESPLVFAILLQNASILRRYGRKSIGNMCQEENTNKNGV